MAFECVTTGNLVNFVLRFDKGLQGTLRFESNNTTVEIDLAALTRDPHVLFEAPLDQLAEAFVCHEESLPRYLEARFDLDIAHRAQLPYFLRVTQLDEGKAWTSPFYLVAHSPLTRG